MYQIRKNVKCFNIHVSCYHINQGLYYFYSYRYRVHALLLPGTQMIR